MNEGLIDNVRALTPKFEAGLNWLAENPNIGEARGKGLMGAVEAVADKATKTPFASDLSVSERIANTCTDHGTDLPTSRAGRRVVPSIYHDRTANGRDV